MRILILGASGRTGTLALTEALTRNHTVTAIVRRPGALAPQPNLSIITGTPLDKDVVSKAFASAPKTDPVRAVISTLASSRTSDNPWAKTTSSSTLMADSVRNTLAVMKEHGVKKIVVLGTIGIGSSRANSGWFFNWVVDHSNLKIAFDDHYEVQKVLEEEAEKDRGLKWIDVRATGLSNGERQEVKEFGNEGKGVGWWISRKSVAGFMLDAVEGDRWDLQTPVISH